MMESKLIKSINVPDDVRKLNSGCKTVEIYNDRVVCLETSRGNTTHYFKNYIGVDWAPAGLLSAIATIVFLTPQNASDPTTQGMFTNLVDTNRIGFCSGTFSQKKANQFVCALHEDIKKVMDDYQSTVSTKNTTSHFSSADELKKYKDLLDSGIITQDEFDAKKKQLLGL